MSKEIAKNNSPKKELSDEKFDEYINNLSEEITPQRNLWQGIELAIQDKPQESSQHTRNNRRVISASAWAASLVAAVLVTWLSFGPGITVDNKQTADSINLVNLMSDNFNQQKKAILVSYGQNDTALLSSDMQKQLQQLASARKSIEKALLEDANNGDLLNLLNFTQQQELNLLQRLYSTQWQTI